MNDATFVNESPEGLEHDPNRVPGGPIEQAEGTVRRVWYAGIGAAATACDVASDTFDRFVDRGARAQEELRLRADDVRARNMGTRGRVGEALRGAMNTLLDGVNIPNKSDVDTINHKLNYVTRKLDDLQLQQVRAAGVTPPVVPDEPVPPDEAEGMVGI
ncbi:MAG TPA: hypothetical protein VF221_23255 [Chloroflexota bacterium]